MLQVQNRRRTQSLALIAGLIALLLLQRLGEAQPDTQSNTKASPATVTAFYTPFSIAWEEDMTIDRLQKPVGQIYRLTLTETDWLYIRNCLSRHSQPGQLNKQRLGLVIKDPTGTDLLWLDTNGNGRYQNAEFRIEPIDHVRISGRLEALRRKQNLGEYESTSAAFATPIVPDSRTARQIAVAVWQGHYGTTIDIPQSRIHTELRGDRWWVTVPAKAASTKTTRQPAGKLVYWLEIEKGAGRVRQIGHTKEAPILKDPRGGLLPVLVAMREGGLEW